MINNQLIEFENHFWSFNQTCKSLHEYRQEISSRWDDNAANEVNNRYLNPHEEDSGKSINHYQNQITQLLQLNKHLLNIESLIEKANKLSREIEILINFCKADIKKSYHSLNDSIDKKNEANHWLNKTKDALSGLKELKKAHNRVDG